MDTKWTPGEWQVKARPFVDPTCPEFLILQGTGYLATVDSSRGENVANAHLIAAAPDLYAVLQLLDERGHTDATWRLAKRAMAKARGETA